MQSTQIALLLLILAGKVYADEPIDAPVTPREVYTCNDEAKRFNSWASIAGRLDTNRLKAHYPGVLLIEVKMADGRVIRGVSARSEMPRSNAVLVIGGNGWSAKPFVRTVLPNFKTFDTDVYYFYFRGYGMSTPANPTMHAIIEDYRELAKWILNEGHARLYLYAFSFGGVVAPASFPQLSPFERIVVDSSPSRASEFGFSCNPTYETVDFLPSDCARLTVMHGTSDWVMPRPKVSELIGAAKKCGAAIDINMSRGHPFQIELGSSRKLRVDAVMKHFGIERKQ